MTYLVNFRALCYDCEKAEATLWCIQDQCASCQSCDEKIHSGNRMLQRHERMEIVKSSVLSTLCNECNLVPASYYDQGRDTTLCELCMKERKDSSTLKDSSDLNGAKDFDESIIPLQQAHVTDSIVFDKMDFTSCYAEKKRKSRRSARLILAGLGAQETPVSKVDRWLSNRKSENDSGDGKHIDEVSRVPGEVEGITTQKGRPEIATGVKRKLSAVDKKNS